MGDQPGNPASSIEYFSELNRLLGGSVQFDEY